MGSEGKGREPSRSRRPVSIDQASPLSIEPAANDLSRAEVALRCNRANVNGRVISGAWPSPEPSGLSDPTQHPGARREWCRRRHDRLVPQRAGRYCSYDRGRPLAVGEAAAMHLMSGDISPHWPLARHALAAMVPGIPWNASGCVRRRGGGDQGWPEAVLRHTRYASRRTATARATAALWSAGSESG